MQVHRFLAKLHDKGVIQLVDPNPDLKQAYLQRSAESMSSAKALLKIGNLRDSVALSYFSMYHCLLALFFRIGIKCENHVASIALMKEVFGLDNAAIAKAKSERIDKQYYSGFEVERKEAELSIKAAEDFVAMLTDFTEHTGTESVEAARKKLTALVKGEKIKGRAKKEH